MIMNLIASLKKESLSNINFTNFTPSVSQQEIFDKINEEINDYNNRVTNEETESNHDHPITCNYYDVIMMLMNFVTVNLVQQRIFLLCI